MIWLYVPYSVLKYIGRHAVSQQFIQWDSYNPGQVGPIGYNISDWLPCLLSLPGRPYCHLHINRVSPYTADLYAVYLYYNGLHLHDHEDICRAPAIYNHYYIYYNLLLIAMQGDGVLCQDS